MLDLLLAVECLPLNTTLDYDDAARVLCRTMKMPASDRGAADGILYSFQMAGLVERGPGKRHQSVTRVSPPHVTRTPAERRGSTMVAIVDEWNNTRDWPVGPTADAEIERVKRVRMSAERARLLSILGTDA